MPTGGVGHAHWFPPLCVLTDCWCLRLQSGVVAVGVIMAIVASFACAFHICNLILAPSIGEQHLYNNIHRNYNISMFKVYKQFWYACRHVCDFVTSRNPGSPPEGSGDTPNAITAAPTKGRILFRAFQKQLPALVHGYGGSWKKIKELFEKLEGPVNKYRASAMRAEHLVVPFEFLSQYGPDAVEQFMLQHINFNNPLSLDAGRAFWKAWKKTKAALRLQEVQKMGQKVYDIEEKKERQMAMRILSGKRSRARNPAQARKKNELHGLRQAGKKEAKPIGFKKGDIFVQMLPYDATSDATRDGFSANPCWKDCIWPRVIVDINMNNVRIRLLNEVFGTIYGVCLWIEILGLILAIVAMVLGPMLVCGAMLNNPWKILPWLVYGGFYFMWCCFYVDMKTGLIFWEIGYWNKYTAPSLIAGTAFVIILTILALFVVMSYYYLIFTVGIYLHHYPRTTQLVVSGGIEEK